jgi:hypothetical protein
MTNQETTVNRLHILSLSVITALGLGLISIPAQTQAQSANDLVGTWQLVSTVNTAKDGTKSDAFGPSPKGMFIFTADGHFAQVLTRASLPKFTADNRAQGTADENKAVVQGSIAVFGTYKIADKVLALNVESSTYPNWAGTEQKRAVTSLNGNELAYTLQASIGGTNVTTYKRVK